MKGSANLEFSGNEQLKKLYLTLDEIAETIPQDINWVLQVEGTLIVFPLLQEDLKIIGIYLQRELYQ